jgi:excisionase family DNA binding protein
MSESFLTIKQTAKILGVTTLTLRNWDNSGKFEASRHPINNYRVYKKSDVDAFIEKMGTKNSNTRKNKNQVKKLNVLHIED